MTSPTYEAKGDRRVKNKPVSKAPAKAMGVPKRASAPSARAS